MTSPDWIQNMATLRTRLNPQTRFLQAKEAIPNVSSQTLANLAIYYKLASGMVCYCIGGKCTIAVLVLLWNFSPG